MSSWHIMSSHVVPCLYMYGKSQNFIVCHIALHHIVPFHILSRTACNNGRYALWLRLILYLLRIQFFCSILNLWHRCARNGRRARPCKFIGSDPMEVPQLCKSIWCGDIHGHKPYKFIGPRATIIAHTSVVRDQAITVLCSTISWHSTVQQRIR